MRHCGVFLNFSWSHFWDAFSGYAGGLGAWMLDFVDLVDGNEGSRVVPLVSALPDPRSVARERRPPECTPIGLLKPVV